jgi:hypothetical protein
VIRRRAALAAFVLLCACPGKHEPAAPKEAEAPPITRSASDDRDERHNLASLPNGACVVERTGEAYLLVSAMNLIDGNPDTYWSPPPHDLPQSITVALPARARIESIGLRSQAGGDHHLHDARVEASLGEGAFATVANISLNEATATQFFNIPPVEADKLRVTILSGLKGSQDVRVDTFIARGRELEAPPPPHAAGTWRINGCDASLAQFGNHLAGAVQINSQPMHLEGGIESNRMLRLLWIRGAEFGVFAASVSRDGKHLCGIDWHEEPIELFHDEAWFGDRISDATPPDDSERFGISYLQHAGRWPLYGLTFGPDGTLDAAASDHALKTLINVLMKAPATISMRIVSHEFREANAKANRVRALRASKTLQAELVRREVDLARDQGSARLLFINAGSDSPRQLPVTDTMRLLYSSVDLEIRR